MPDSSGEHLYLTLLGTAAIEAHKRRWVDVHTYRSMSDLKLSWEWVISYVRKRRIFSTLLGTPDFLS